MNYLCAIPGCLSSTTKLDGLYAFGRVDRWRTHMIKMHGLSKEEVRSIVKRGIPMEKKAPKQAAEMNMEEVWGLDDDVEDLEDDGWNDITYEDEDES
jgi:alcohol dehydrogenase YqhD (iron-dependent ADH family)